MATSLEEAATMLHMKKDELAGEGLNAYLREGSWVKSRNYSNLSDLTD
jgi:hypothetical protein